MAKNNYYSKEIKIQTAIMRNSGYSLSYIRNNFNIKSDSQIIQWTRKFNEFGDTAFDIDLRGKSSGIGQGRPKTNFSSIEEELKYLKMENEYLKKLRALQKVNQKINKYEIILQMNSLYSVLSLCKAANVNRSSFYKWKNKSINKNSYINQQITELILKAYSESKGTYGTERLHLYVKRYMSIPINRKRVHRIKTTLGLQAIIRKKFYYRKYNPAKVAENILERNFISTKPLEKLCMDITYIPVSDCSSRFIYLNAIKDLYNGEIVAYDLSLRNDIALVNSTLSKLYKLSLEKSCILHSDQGVTYSRVAYIEQLKEHGIQASMSRRGNCWDNAPIESFFSHLKSESIYLSKIKSYDGIITEISEYIDYYNNKRIQKKLNGLSPVEYRTKTA